MHKEGPMAEAGRPATVAYLSLGANVGDPGAQLDRAIRAIGRLPHTHVSRQSARYWTQPVGVTEQPPFLNQVIEVVTHLDAPTLLAHALAIEADLGRVRTLRWGPRTIDIDILAFGDEQHDAPELTVPHPRLHERAFVLVPWAELVPDLVVAGAPLSRHLANLPAGEVAGVERVTPRP